MVKPATPPPVRLGYAAPKAPKSRRVMCRECQRDIELVTQDDSTTIKLDTEVVSVVMWPGGREIVQARRLHTCIPRKKP